MAVTALINNSNRVLSKSYLRGTVASVALDATMREDFTLPVGFGALLIESLKAFVSAFSGAYVAPTPAFDGLEFDVQSTDATTTLDSLGAYRFVHSGTASTRPVLSVYIEFFRPTIIRQNERIIVLGPVLAGAGVTGTVGLAIRGQRIDTA